MTRARAFLAALCSACFAIVGCQSNIDGPAEASPQTGESISVTIEAATVAALPTCSTMLNGQIAYVTSTQKLYACSSRSWRELTCSSTNLGAVAYASTSNTLLACVANVWRAINPGSGSAGTGMGGTGGMMGGTGGVMGGTGGVMGGTGGTGGGMTVQPTIPAITGTCPTFATGTITFMNLAGIQLKVGPKGMGGGSLVFYWHGTGSNSNEFNSMIPLDDQNKILNAGGMFVSFQNSTGTGGDCSGTATFSQGDFAIADQIAACAVRDYNIDPRRIYTTGCSAGGLQAGCMGFMRSSYIAAVTANSGGQVFPLMQQSPNHIPAAMTMHGAMNVDVVGVDFSQTSAMYDQAIKAAGGFAVDCNDGLGHCAAPAELQSSGIQFMLDHPFGASPEPYTMGLPSSFPTYCAIQ